MTIKTLTVELKYTIEPATDNHVDDRPLQLVDGDGDRIAFVTDDDEAVRLVRVLHDGMGGNEIDIDGTIQ